MNNLEEASPTWALSSILPANSSQTDSIEDYIVLSFNKKLNPLSASSQFDNRMSVGGIFHDLSNNLTSVGNLYLNNNIITRFADNSYKHSSFSDFSEGGGSGTPDFRTLYGQNVDVKIDGNSLFNTFTETVRVPANLNLTAGLPYGTSYIQGSGITLNWTSDPGDQFGQVRIECYYYRALSKNLNTNSPDSIASFSVTVPDNGSYTLSPAQLSAFPLNTYFGFSIGRLSQYKVQMTSSNKKVFIFAVAEVSSKPILVSLRPSVYVRLERTNDYFYSDPYTTIESTNYYVRSYLEATCGMPAILAEQLTVSWAYRVEQWNNSGYSSYESFSGSGNIDAGSAEVNAPGYTELYTYYSGSDLHTRKTYWLILGPYYNINVN